MFLITTIIPRLSRASVVYFDGLSSYFAVKPGEIQFPNGIARSKDSSRVFVASTANPGILFSYYFDSTTPGTLLEDKKLVVGTGIDNLDVAEDSSVWAGCHPNAILFLLHAAGVLEHAPSQVLQIEVSNTEDIKVTEKFSSAGELVPASSCAVQTRNLLVVTPVFSDHFALCYR